jgi:hypothetical protein
MSVFHCPLCPLIFQHRTEAEWHLREEHRSRAGEEADLREELAAATTPLDRDRLRRLRGSKSSPSVTLLMGTAPAPTMTVLDIARLRQLAERARRRLSGEPDRDTAASVVEYRLSRAVSAAESLPTERGLAVLVNERDMAIVSLPFSPRDRQVVDRAFATRDLEYALRRYPSYRILVLGHHLRILEGRVDRLSEPTTAPAAQSPRVVSTAGTTHLIDADDLLTQRIEVAGNLPLIVIGDRRHLGHFEGESRFTDDVVAVVPRPRLRRAGAENLASQAIAGLHEERQARAIAELLHTEVQGQVAWGIHAAWSAVRTRTADRLWVEHDFAIPGRIVPGPSGIEATSDPAEPGVIDDLVDALLTAADELDIPVDLLDRGALDRPEPIAVRTPLGVATQSGNPRALATI